MENPTVDDVSDPVQDDVDHDHVSPRELVESPKGARESVPRSSPDEHDDMHELFAESHGLQENSDIVTFENSDGSRDGNEDLIDGSTHVVTLQRQEVHPSKNI